MDKYCVVSVTVPDLETGEKLAVVVLEARLAACVQVSLSPVKSFYWWKGEVKTENEFTLSIKTESDIFYKLKEVILKNHPYEIPEILLTPIPSGLSSYFDWIDNEIN